MEDSAEPLPGVGAFFLWLLAKVLALAHLRPLRLIPSRPFARIGSARRNGDTKRSKVNENAPLTVDANEAGRPSIAILNDLLAGNSAYPIS